MHQTIRHKGSFDILNDLQRISILAMSLNWYTYLNETLGKDKMYFVILYIYLISILSFSKHDVFLLAHSEAFCQPSLVWIDT